MKIKLTCYSGTPGAEGNMGDVIDVTAERAKWFRDIRGAKPLDRAARKLWGLEDDEPETATVGPPENAAKRTKRAEAR